MIDASDDPESTSGQARIRDVLSEAQRRLQAAGVPSPGPDSIELLCHVLGIPRSRLFLADLMSVADRVRYERLLMRRCARVPLQHLTGRAAFRRLELSVGTGVFVPRPETEVVAQAAIDHLAGRTDRRAVDLCTGSAAIALALATEVSGAEVVAVEKDAIAASWARLNIESQSEALAAVGSNVELHLADAMTCADDGGPLAPIRGTCAVVVTNPPYIPITAQPQDPEVRDYDPVLALYGGADGLDVVRGVVRTAALLLSRGGLLVVEHADVQGEQVVALLAECAVSSAPAYADIRTHRDLTRRPRFATAVRV